MTLEAAHERAGTQYARRKGWTAFKLAFTGKRGAPDRLYAHPQHGVVFVEWKRPGKEPTAQQEIRHAEMRAAGLRVEWFDCVERFIAWVDTFDDTGL